MGQLFVPFLKWKYTNWRYHQPNKIDDIINSLYVKLMISSIGFLYFLFFSSSCHVVLRRLVWLLKFNGEAHPTTNGTYNIMILFIILVREVVIDKKYEIQMR